MDERASTRHLHALIAGLALVVGCDTSRGSRAAEGTRRMGDTLATLHALAVADPGKYEFLNRERADALQATVQQQAARRGQPDLRDVFALARERLFAGDTRQAIDLLERMRLTTRVTLSRGTPETKQFFDLLALAHLRLGEQQNCNLYPNRSVCVLGALHHAQQEGAQNAIAQYEAILREFPADHGSRWLLNIAYMATGGYPARVPRQWLIANLTTKRDAGFPTFVNVANAANAELTTLAGGLCADDFDGDGHIDLFTTAWGLNDVPHVLMADGAGGYVDRTDSAGVRRIVGGPNCRQADYDNDGDVDVFIMRGGWLGDGGRFPNSLLRNRGDGSFEDVTFAAGLGSLHPTHSAAWGDFNLDGYVDLFVGNESGVSFGGGPHPSELFLNNRDGTFTDVAPRVGIALDAFVKGVAWGDVDNDGLPDLFASIFAGPNRLFINRGGGSADSWRFEEVTAAAGVAEPHMSFPAWFWDYDNDGWEDLLVLSYDNRTPLHTAVAREYLGLAPEFPQGGARPADHTHLYRNRGNGTFEDVSAAAGLADKAIFAMGSNFGDLDNDGWLDFYVGTGNPDLRSIIPNRMFRGVAGRSFQEVTIEGGFGHLQKGHGTAFADLDRDGDQDVFMMLGGAYSGDVFPSVLFENPGWPERAWITLQLEGRASSANGAAGANRSAIGARVEIATVGPSGARRSIHRTVGTGGSYGSGTLQVHAGLGAADSIAFVRVSWPDSARTVETFANLAPRRTYRLMQGRSPEQLDRPVVAFRGSRAAASHAHPER